MTVDTPLNIPSNVVIRDYQQKAYENWVSNNHTGIFAMATGSGKTVTALNCVYRDFKEATTLKQSAKCHLIILVPTQPLLLQWCNQLKLWSFANIYSAYSATNWKSELQSLLNDIRFGIDNHFAIVTTYKTFTTEQFQSILRELPKNMFLIADEAHNMGQPQVRKLLSELNIRKKIGLTATPKRVYDPEGTQAIEDYFKDKEPYCFSFFMEQAIMENALCHYDYYPKLVELQADELKAYIELTKQIAKLSGANSEDSHNIKIERLLLKRKRIINKAGNKIQILKDIIKEVCHQSKLKFCFTYVSDGDTKEEEKEYSIESKRIIRRMQQVFDETQPGIRTHVYLGETKDREEILHGFERGDIDVLLAMKCLDEGVDIPRTAIGIFTSSSGNPRQYIQRRGRILRSHPDKEKAIIYDMIVIPKITGDRDSFNTERQLVQKELIRVGYFAMLSDNFYNTKHTLQEICDFYQLNLDSIIKELAI